MTRIDDLRDKAVLITGASTGIGAAAARAFGAQGARVAIHYNKSGEAAEAVAESVRGHGAEAVLVQGDVASSAAVEGIIKETVAKLGRLDVLINNAGSLIQRTPVADASDALFDEVLNINVRSVFVACRAAIPQFRKQGGGNIINTSSIAARHGGGPGSCLYASSKAFVSNFTRGLAKELARDKVRVNAVAPGVIETPFHERFSTPEQMKIFAATVPLGRLGVSEDCAGAFLWLASDALSGYVTGQIIEVNGGQLMP